MTKIKAQDHILDMESVKKYTVMGCWGNYANDRFVEFLQRKARNIGQGKVVLASNETNMPGQGVAPPRP